MTANETINASEHGLVFSVTNEAALVALSKINILQRSMLVWLLLPYRLKLERPRPYKLIYTL